MSLFSEIMNKIASNGYICPECGAEMEFADDDVLVCPTCNYSCDKDDYTDVKLEEEGFYDNEDEDPDYNENTYEDL